MNFDDFLSSFADKKPLPKKNILFKVVSWFFLVNIATFISLLCLFSLIFREFYFHGLLNIYKFVLPLSLLYYIYYVVFVLKKAVIDEYKVNVIDPDAFHNQMESDVYRIVEALRLRAGLDSPVDVGFYNSSDMNAMAVGRNSDSALIVFSWGLLNKMDGYSIAAVAGHEIAHVANGDMITTSLLLAATNTATSIILAPFYCARFALVVAVSLLFKGEASVVNFIDDVFRIFAFSPVKNGIMLFSSLVENGFSRYREYKADAMSAVLTDRDYLIAALNCFGAADSSNVDAKGAYSTYQINSPSEVVKSYFSSTVFADLFKTHPAIEKRVSALKNVSGSKD